MATEQLAPYRGPTAGVSRAHLPVPAGAILMGYGGSTIALETVVYSYKGFEVRFPLHPDLFDSEQVSAEYGCLSGTSWEDIDELIADIA